MDFKPINKTTVPNEIVEQMISMVRSGSLKLGEKLPSERQLAENLKVGRSSVREAMKVLEALGLIHRTNEGTIICEPGGNDPSIFFLSPSQTTILEVFETRKLMEIELAGLAAERATPEDIKKMIDALAKTEDLKEVTQRDISFHRAIVEAAHNSVFSQVYKMISGLLFQTHRYHYLIRLDPAIPEKEIKLSLKRYSEAHQGILQTIKVHDRAGAKKEMKKHLNYAEKTLLEKVGKRSKTQT